MFLACVCFFVLAFAFMSFAGFFRVGEAKGGRGLARGVVGLPFRADAGRRGLAERPLGLPGRLIAGGRAGGLAERGEAALRRVRAISAAEFVDDLQL